MNVKELREAAGMSLKEYAEYFKVPYRTVQDWNAGARACPEYLLNLMEYKLQNEGLLDAGTDDDFGKILESIHSGTRKSTSLDGPGALAETLKRFEK